jgi:hypothetical protein
VRVTPDESLWGAVSRHQGDATADDLLALLNAVITGAVFSESMLANAYAARQCVQPKRARHEGGSILQMPTRLNGAALSVGSLML